MTDKSRRRLSWEGLSHLVAARAPRVSPGFLPSYHFSPVAGSHHPLEPDNLDTASHNRAMGNTKEQFQLRTRLDCEHEADIAVGGPHRTSGLTSDSTLSALSKVT
jgi:hypothetical protein